MLGLWLTGTCTVHRYSLSALPAEVSRRARKCDGKVLRVLLEEARKGLSFLKHLRQGIKNARNLERC